ncbi:nuclease-related domain-containing protein [Heyndrickxia acidiproducens]|uniref:nuclease-related domain-containing protein n=1 Tax=Heyndrickxia acidiproducens TaxID=1121084 RepID=UPI00035CBD69|nr:nuclease-related domain-containing protein [Heyndrickxia acidiproducens]
MVIKERQISRKMKQLEVLLRRLSANHPKRLTIESDYKKIKAGYKGELEVDYHVGILPQKESLILYDLRLPIDQQYFFQMDTLILTQNFFLILEIKNISGILNFESEQLIRMMNGKEEAFRNPVTQVLKQEMHLKEWIKKHKFPGVPICSLVVISNPSSIMKINPTYTEAIDKVIKADSLFLKLEKIMKQYPVHRLNQRQMKNISNQLMREQNEMISDILTVYQLSENDLIKGVQCPSCFSAPMDRNQGIWICHQCGKRDKHAHFQALHDFSLIYRPVITNRDLRSFLQISSPHIAHSLLTSLNLPYSGTGKNRRYDLSKL